MKNYKFDYSFLTYLVITKMKSKRNYAVSLGISYQELSKKFNNCGRFTQEQIFDSIKILVLSEADVCNCFFKKIES